MCLTVALIVALPFVGLKKDENLELIYGTFVGKKSKYQGIIEIWNIDTFEGGLISKTSYLNAQAKVFQKQNKGLYILIRNISEQECLNLLFSGEKPDLFSCSYGVSTEIFDYLEPLSLDYSCVMQNFLNAGKVAGEQYFVPWCFSNYFLVSTGEHMKNAKVEIKEDFKLRDVALTSGYVVSKKSGDKTIYSLGLGQKKYLLPNFAFLSYTNTGLTSVSETAIDPIQIKESPYSAYAKFIIGETSVLLGTNRDVFRIDARASQGKISDVILERVSSFTDLVQFFGMTKNQDATKKQYTELFAKFVIQESKDMFLKNGLFSVVSGAKTDSKPSIMKDITLDNFESYTLNNVCVSKKEIEGLQQK